MNIRCLWLLLLLLLGWRELRAQTFTVGTYNVEMYIERGFSNVLPKTAAAKARVQESIVALQADILALQEIGTTNLLIELQNALGNRGLNYPYWEFVYGSDTNLHLALLSRFPIVERRPRVSDAFLLSGRRFFVSRGFLEVDVQVNSGYRFTLLAAHLKSKRLSFLADEEEIREQEAILLGERVKRLLAGDPQRNVVVLGDFNDYKSTQSVKTLLGKGNTSLVDTRPSERRANSRTNDELRNVAWTHFFVRDDVYSRIDYIFLSRGMAREWVRDESYVLARPDWFEASDHRPVVVQIQSVDR